MALSDLDPANPIQLNIAGQKKNPFLKEQENIYGGYGLNKVKKQEVNPYTFFNAPSPFDENLIDTEAFKQATSNVKLLSDSMKERSAIAKANLQTGVGADYQPVDTSALEEAGTDASQIGTGVNAGLAALSAIPKVMAVTQDKARSKKEAFAKGVSLVGTGASTGASIGTAIMPGVGTAVGAGIGAFTGFIGSLAANAGWKKKFRAEEDKNFLLERAEQEKELLQNYYASNNSKQIKAQYDLLSKINGYEPS